jgi:ATP-dependent DNA helicase RecQ
MTTLRPEQKKFENHVQQLRNLDGLFTVSMAKLPPGPVLVIDDMVDSGWTFTIASLLLRQAGCNAVWPLALARTGKGDDE